MLWLSQNYYDNYVCVCVCVCNLDAIIIKKLGCCGSSKNYHNNWDFINI
jgi:hypothetical protein